MQEYKGTLSDTFQRIEQIGKGGGGIVFRAYHKRLDIDVVLKRIHSGAAKKINVRAELDILKRLKHPYIPQVFDLIECEEGIFTVMELIEGQSFDRLLQQKRRFKQKDIVRWAGQLCEVVEYLHSRRPPIIHCDIKPANVMLTPVGDICLIDFNISGVKTEEGIASIGYSNGYSPAEQFALVAKRAGCIRQKEGERSGGDGDSGIVRMPGAVVEVKDESTEIDCNVTEIDAEMTEIDEDITQAGQNITDLDRKTIESSRKMAEKSLLKSMSNDDWNRARQVTAFLGSSPVLDERADIYGVGATLYHILTGVRPQPFYLPYVPVQEAAAGISESFANVIDKALSLKPADRFKTSAQLLKTVRNMSAIDKRYKRLVRRQAVTTFCITGLAAVFFVMTFAGRNRMGQEKLNTYHAYVGEMAQAREAGDYERVREGYMQSWQLMAGEQDAYYEMAMAYFDQKDYEGCIRFLEENVFSNTLLTKDKFYSRFLYLCGRCHLETEDYGKAATQYEQALILQPEALSYYSDYVVALARGGRIDEAEEVLRQAMGKGISGEIFSLLRGEIALVKKDFVTAQEAFQTCIDSAQDEYNLLRAYSGEDEVYQARYQGQEQYEKRMVLLTEALERLPQTRQITLAERLAQVYIDYGALSGERKYDEMAIALFRQMEAQGTVTFTGQMNIAVLYEKDGEYEMAKQQLEDMLERFPDNYRIYKRLARLELAIQDERETRDREYHQFAQYYRQARETYEENAGVEDSEMLLLDQLYEDVVSNGWL